MSRRAVGASDEARAEGARYYWTREVDGEGRLDSAPVSRFARFCLLQRRRGRRCWSQSVVRVVVRQIELHTRGYASVREWG